MFNLLNVTKKILKSKEGNNASWIIGEQIFQMLIHLIIGILSARYLGPANYGLINYTASYVNFVIPIVTLGMDGVIIKKMIESPNDEGKFLGGCIIYRIVSAFVCGISIILLVWSLNPKDKLMLAIICVQSIQLVFRAINILDSWFQRHLKSRYVSIAKMVACVLVAFYQTYLLITYKSVIWFAISNSLTALIVAFVLIVSYKKNASQKIKCDFKSGKSTLIESYHFIISGVMVSVYGQIDRIMLGEMISSEAVGLYTVSAALCTMWLFIPTAIINSFRPSILELKNSGNETQYLIRLKQLYAAIFYLCVVVSVFVFILGGPLICWLYGNEFAGASVSLKLLIWSECFSMLGVARGIWVLAEQKNKYVKYYLGIGAGINGILNYILIPQFGIGGAAFATLVTQLITCVVAPMFFKETRIHTVILLQAISLKEIIKR